MPITFACTCGKTLRVKEEHAGRWVRCPACQETAIVPEIEPPAFEVVEEAPPPPPARTRVRAEPAAERYEVDEDDRPRSRRRPDDRDDDDRPRRDPDGRDDDDDRPRRAKKRPKSRPKPEGKQSHFAMEKGVLNGGVAVGLLAMVGAVVWFVVGLMNDILFYYPPVLFVLGLIGFCKGLVGGGDE